MPGDPGPVGKHCYHGGHHCGTGRDQGDLPTRHASGDDGMDGGHGNDAALPGFGWRQASQCRRCGTTESKQCAAIAVRTLRQRRIFFIAVSSQYRLQ